MNDFEFDQMDGIPGSALEGVPAPEDTMDDGQPEMHAPPPPVYNLQPPMGISITTPTTVPQAFQPQQIFAKPQDNMIGSGAKGPDVLFRVHMGLQSGVTSEIDWCLTTLLTFTTARNFGVLKSRVDIMLLVIDFINKNWGAVTSSSSDLDDSYETLRTRQKVLDALLIIRNVCIDQSMAQQLAQHVTSFVERGTTLPNSSLYTEMRLLCLEISEHVCFYFPNQSSESPMFHGLVELLNSTDKSVLITAVRSLTRLLVFDVKESSPLLAHVPQLKRLFSMLLIDDMDLTAAILDLLVQFTGRLQRVEQLQAFDLPKLVNHLIRLLTFKMEHGPTDYLRLPRRTRKPAPAVPPEIPASIMSELLAMNEPERATMWIRSSYDTDPEGEVMQVALWTGYQRAFEPHERDGSGKRMLKAIDFIRTCTTNVRGAQAKVVTLPDGQRKFIIKGLVPREKAVPPSQLLSNGMPTNAAAVAPVNGPDVPAEETEKESRLPPVYGGTVALVLLNIAKLQGGKEVLEPFVGNILGAITINPAVTENADRLLTEIKAK